MPTGTKVHRLFEKLKALGHDDASAAKIAQDTTGQSLKTGKPLDRGVARSKNVSPGRRQGRSVSSPRKRQSRSRSPR